MRLPLHCLTVLAATLCLLEGNPAQAGLGLADDVQIEKLADGVWRHVTVSNYPGFGLVSANGLIVANPAGAVLIDTGWAPRQTSCILDWIKTNLHVKVLCVIVTHSHADRMGGIAEALRRQLRVIACEQTAALAKATGLPLPTETFVQSRQLPVGDEILAVEHPGAGHTKDNVIVWVSRAKVLFGGCLVKSPRDNSLGYTRDADLGQWPKTLEKVAKEHPKPGIVVPGHGEPGGEELLSHTLDLLRAKP